ncbi:MAG: hypothetical protein PHR35_14445, partial [Kiritimatiellae bacterium]|nr:hypothetical protein [Kiritimatiellia bacterium]
MQTGRRIWRWMAVVLAATLLTGRAAYVDWDPISGNDWGTAANWSNDTTKVRALPTSGDIPCIGRLGANSEQPCVVTGDGTVGGSSLYVSVNNRNGNLRVLSGSLNIGNEFRICYNGNGVAHVIQSNGAVTAGGSVNIASYGAAGQRGIYELAGGSVACVGDMNVAGTGPGTFIQTGGTNAPGRLYVGNSTVAYTGVYELAEGRLQSGVSSVGQSGEGRFVMSGGAWQQNGTLYVGWGANSRGTLIVSNGSL